MGRQARKYLNLADSVFLYFELFHEFLLQDFQGANKPRPSVHCLVHFAVSTLSDLLQDAEVVDVKVWKLFLLHLMDLFWEKWCQGFADYFFGSVEGYLFPFIIEFLLISWPLQVEILWVWWVYCLYGGAHFVSPFEIGLLREFFLVFLWGRLLLLVDAVNFGWKFLLSGLNCLEFQECIGVFGLSKRVMQFLNV